MHANENKYLLSSTISVYSVKNKYQEIDIIHYIVRRQQFD